MNKKRNSKAKLVIITMITIITFAIFTAFGVQDSKNHNLVMNTAIVAEVVEEPAPINSVELVYATPQEGEQVIEEAPIVEETMYTTAEVNMRDNPSMEGKIIKVLTQNSQITKIGEDGEWTKIKWSDTEIYYIHSKYISKEKTPVVQKTQQKVTSRHQESSEARSGTKAEYQQYAHSLFSQYGWSDADYEALIKLWTKESDWNPNAHNNSSGAHGIPQSLPASKMASEGADYYTNGKTQIRWGLKYISQRYGTPSKAWQHWCNKGWY